MSISQNVLSYHTQAHTYVHVMLTPFFGNPVYEDLNKEKCDMVGEICYPLGISVNGILKKIEYNGTEFFFSLKCHTNRHFMQYLNFKIFSEGQKQGDRRAE